MATSLDDDIAYLKVQIERYEYELNIASSETRKDLLYGLIKSSRDNLTELLRQKNPQPGAYSTPSKSALSNRHIDTVSSAVKEDRKVDAKLKNFLSELVEATKISFLINGEQIAVQKDDQSAWFEAAEGGFVSQREVRQHLKVPEYNLQLTTEDIETYGITHDANMLHIYGETEYQKWFNDRNVGKRSNQLLGTHSSNSKIPIAKQHENGFFNFSGKIDNISVARPLGVEFKGEKFKEDHQPSKGLSARHFDVLEQSLRRVYSISCIQQYFANIGVFAVCFDRIWLVWYERKLLPAEVKQQETIHVINICPDDLGYFWALLTKQALENRNVMFQEENDDYNYLIDFLNGVYPNMAHYCRVRFVNRSMNSVYAVTLPQLSGHHSTLICVSKNEKHFALKIISNQSEFEQEVRCITAINQYFKQYGFPQQEFPYFYAFGSKAWNSPYILHSKYDVVNFNIIKIQMSEVLVNPERLEGAMKALTIDTNHFVKPWWLFEPGPSKPLAGGVIVMLCGDYYHHVTPYNVKEAIYGAQYWLDMYHKAGVVHRDIRLSNILRFDYPPTYVTIANKKLPGVSASDLCSQWQLIDFNLGCCLNEGMSEVSTTLQRNSAQWKNAGRKVRQKLQDDADQSLEVVEVSWNRSDDNEMLVDLILTFVR